MGSGLEALAEVENYILDLKKENERLKNSQVHIVIPHLYENKAGLARVFGISRTQVYNYLPEFEERIKEGRYGDMAIIDGRIHVGAFADFLKYRTRFKDKNARKYVPPFNVIKSTEILIPDEA